MEFEPTASAKSLQWTSPDNPSAFVERCHLIASRGFSSQTADQSDFSQNVGTDTTMFLGTCHAAVAQDGATPFEVREWRVNGATDYCFSRGPLNSRFDF